MCQPWSYGAVTRSDTETDADPDKLTQSPMGLVLASFVSVQYEHLPELAIAAGGTHPTGMHSCSYCVYTGRDRGLDRD